MLKRYWLVLYPEDRYGPFNVGVTATSVEEAKELVLKNFRKISFYEPLLILEEKNNIEVIEDIDLQLLDQAHILPNIGPVIFKGVWFPRLNLYEEI